MTTKTASSRQGTVGSGIDDGWGDVEKDGEKGGEVLLVVLVVVVVVGGGGGSGKQVREGMADSSLGWLLRQLQCT